MPSLEASETDFLDGDWIDRIDKFLALPKVCGENRTNGEEEASRLIGKLLGST